MITIRNFCYRSSVLISAIRIKIPQEVQDEKVPNITRDGHFFRHGLYSEGWCLFLFQLFPDTRVRLVIQTPPPAPFVVVPPHRHWAAIPTQPYHPVVIVRTYPRWYHFWRKPVWF